MGVVEFLLARVAEDEAAAQGAGSFTPWDRTFERDDYGHLTVQPSRVLAECEAKRRIVELHNVSITREWLNPSDGPAYQEDQRWCAICEWVSDACGTVKALAMPYADHPDYDEAWRP